MPNRNDWETYFAGPEDPEVAALRERDLRIWRELNRLCPPGPGKAAERAKLLAQLTPKGVEKDE